MAPIPASFIDQVRTSTDIVDVVSRVVPLRRAGGNFKGLCPFHREKTPSFNVSPERQIFHCFGCGKGGDVFKFLMLYENMTFTDAVGHLAARVGLTVPETGPETAGERSDRTLLIHLYEEAARFYHRFLVDESGGSRALSYLARRGVSRSTIQERGLGYAPDRWDALLEHLSRKGSKTDDLARAGLVIPRREGRGFYDRFRDRVMIPIRNESGNIVAFGGRLLGTGEPKYLNSPESIVYRKSFLLFDLDRAKDGIRGNGSVILMEGYLDCIQAHQAGITNAVACCGTSLTEGHARLLRRYTDQVVVNFDPDAAGESATKRSIDLLIEEGFQVLVLRLPDGEDPDSFIRNRGAEAYREILSQASPFIDYLIASAAGRHDLKTPRGKAAFLDELAPTLRRIPNHVERAAYIGRIAERADISDRAIVEELRRNAPKRMTTPSSSATDSADSPKPAERDLVRWLLQPPTEAVALLAEIDEEDLRELVTAPILRALKEVVATGPVSTERVLEKLTNEVDRNRLTRIALEPAPLGPRQSARDCLNRLREQRWRRELSRLRADLARGVVDEHITAEIQALARRIENLARIQNLA